MKEYICGIDEGSPKGSLFTCVVFTIDCHIVKSFRGKNSLKKFKRWLWWKRLFGMRIVIMAERKESNYNYTFKK